MEVKVMNATEKKELMGKYAKKLENAIKREATVMKEIENDKALIKYLEGQKTSGAAFDNTVYESYDAWIETIRKQRSEERRVGKECRNRRAAEH